MEISIIIPVYNSEQYLERGIQSVLASLACAKMAGEIILVDNNSTDNSAKIMRKYAKANPRLFTVLQCHTPGASAARNLGVTKARGRYIWFVDADDEITKEATKMLLHAATKTDADLVMMGAKRIYPDGKSNYLSAVRPEEPNFRSRFVRYGAGPWHFLIRRKWWLQCGFKFREGIIHEDMELMSSLILHTDKFAAVDEPLYLYYQNDNSVLHQERFNPQIFDIFPALEGLRERFARAHALQKYHDELEWFFIWNLLIDSAQDFAKFPEGRVGFARSREMLSRYFPAWRKNPFLRQKSLKLKIRVRMNYNK